MKKLYIGLGIIVMLLAGVGFFVTRKTDNLLGLRISPYTITIGRGNSATTTEFFGDVLPDEDSLYNLGSSTKQWLNGYFNGGLATENLIFTHATGVNATIDYLKFSTNTTPTYSEGIIFWDDTEKTLSIDTGLDAVSLQVGQEVVIRVRNNTGAPIPNCSIVYHSGQLGNRPTVALAQANSTTTAKVLGIATQDIAHNSDGFVTLKGNVNECNTAAYTEGDYMYLSATEAGKFVTSTPAAPNIAIRMGSVMISNPAVGRVYVNYDVYNTYIRSYGDMRLHGYIIPASDNTFDFGISSQKWKNGYFGTDVIVGTQSVCLEDGTNCPAGVGSQDLEQVIAANPYATSTPVFYGGLTTSNITATGTITGNLAISTLSTTTTYDTWQDLLNTQMSSGRIAGGTITDLGTGSVQMGAMEMMIKVANTYDAALKFYTMPTSTVALTDNALNYLYVDYNSGIPILQATTDRTTIHEYDQFTVGRAYRSGTSADIVQSGTNIYNEYRRIHNRLIKKYGFDYASGSIVVENSPLKISKTAGVYFMGNTEIDTAATTTAYIKSYYRNGSGGWTLSSASTTMGESVYDNGSGTLTAVLPNQYALFWLYECPQGELYRVYGQNSYTLPNAQIAQPPTSTPDYISQNTHLRAKVYFLRGASSFAQIDNLSADVPLSSTSYSTATSTWYGGIELLRSTSTYATSTNLFSTKLLFTNGTGTSLYSSWLGTGSLTSNSTGATTTNLYVSATGLFNRIGTSSFTANSTGATTTNWYASAQSIVQKISFTNGTGTSLYLSGLTNTSRLNFTNGTGTSLYATNLTVTNVSDLQGTVYTGSAGLISSGNVTSTSFTVGNVGVCLASGANCPGSYNLTALGNITVGSVNASSTISLSGASALALSTGAIPTSTTVEVNSMPYLMYAFNASTTNCVYWMPPEMPGGWDGSLLKPRVTWTAATGTGAVVWRMRAMSQGDNSYLGVNFTSASPSYSTSTLGSGYYRQTEAMDNLTVLGATSGTAIRFEMCRLATSAGDTLGADAYLELVGIDYGRAYFSD
jgi:hypothetical protein